VGIVRIIAATIVLGFPAQGALAGAWTWEEGHGQIGLGGLFSEANNAFAPGRQVQSATRYHKFELQGLVEYGLTDRFTLMVAPGLQHVDIGAPTNVERNGLGYTEFGARWRAWQSDGWVFSTQATFRLPGTTDSANPAAIGYTDSEIDLRALAGKSFTVFGLPAFVNFELAQRVRTGAPPDEFRADATFGLRFAQKWQALAQSFTVISEGSGQPPFTSYDYSKLQLSAVYDFSPGWSVQLGAFSTVAGRNALQENGLVFGLWRRF
jgi:hypothetical protein